MEKPPTDAELIRRFSESGDELAFEALVEKFLPMVLGVAMRRGGDRHLSEEIAQNVFATFARKAGTLDEGVVLSGWLYRAAALETSDTMRREHRSRKKIERYIEMKEEPHEIDETWREVAPELDDAMGDLSDRDREVVLMRFFEGLSFKEIARRVGASDDACQKRTRRALEKLSGFLRKRGVTASAALLGAGLAVRLGEHASGSLVPTIAKGALGLAGSGTTASTSLICAMTTTTSLKLTGIAALAMAIPIAIQWNHNSAAASRLADAHVELATKRESIGARGNAATIDSNADRSEFSLASFRDQISAVENAPHRTNGWMQLVASMASIPAEKFAAAFDLLTASPVTLKKLFVADSFFEHWAKVDPAGALEASRGAGADLRFQSLSGVFSSWIARDPEIAIAALDEAGVGLHMRSQILEKALKKLAQTDPRRAGELTLAHQSPQKVEALLSAIVEKDEPENAMRWLLESPNQKLASTAIPAVLRQLAKDDPKGAMDVALGLEDASLRSKGLASINASWAGSDARGAIEHFLTSIPEADRTPQALEPVTWHLGGESDAQLLEWVDRMSTPVADRFLGNLAARFSEDGIDRAIGFARKLSAEAPVDAFRSIGRGLGAKDPARFDEWIKTVENPKRRTGAVASFALTIASKDPERAIALAVGIEGAERDETLDHVVYTWQATDPAAAKRWFDSTSDISNAEREQLTDLIR